MIKVIACFCLLSACAFRPDYEGHAQEPGPDADGDRPDGGMTEPTPDAGTPTPDAPVTPVNGTISCAESGNETIVTVGPGLLAHLVEGASPTPATDWKVRFGYGAAAEVPWVSDSSSYTLKMSDSVVGFNLTLRKPAQGTTAAVDYWFDLSEYAVSGACALNTDKTEVVHTPPPSIVGTIQCQLKLYNGVNRREMIITPNSGRDIREALAESPAFLPSPSAIQYGSQTDGWTLPYQTGSTKPQAAWMNGTTAYYFYLDPAVDDLNFFVVDDDDPTDSVSGGDYFDLNRWNITNVGSAGCQKVGGGISIN